MGCFSSSSSESKTESQKTLLSELIAKFTPEIGKGPDVFPGETTAGFSKLQETGIDAASSIGGAFTSPQSSAGIKGISAFPGLEASISGLLKPVSQTGQPGIKAASATGGAKPLSSGQFSEFFKSSVGDPTRKTFREETTPAISEAFAGPGFFGTARSKEIVKQKTDLEDRLSSEEAAGQFSNLQRNQQLKESAANRDIQRDQLNLSREEFNRTLGLSVENMNTARAKLGFDQALKLSDSEANTLTSNIAIAASQVQGLKEIMGIGAVEQSQEQAEIFAEIEKFSLENQIVDPQDLSVLFALLDQNFSTGSGAGLGYVSTSNLFS